ncbi:MAG: aminopeptidase N [Thioalkalispiraceae bacterium]|jgi:aminopeptidase N
MLDSVRSDSSTPRTIYLKEYQVPDFLISDVELWFELAEQDTRVRSRLQLQRNPEARNQNAPLVLDGDELELLSVRIDGQLLKAKDYQLTDETLTIEKLADSFILEVETLIHPAANTALEGLYHSGNLLCTQCEAQGFRRITFFPDRPDVMSRYTVTLTADKQSYPDLLANGNLVEHGELDDGRHWAKWQDPSLKPSYLFALVAGQLHCHKDSFTTQGGREVELRVYVDPENAHKTEHAMHSLKQSMRWDEERFGREYDLDIFMIVAVNDFNMGAMENKGLNIFNASCVLASPDTATDADYYNIQSIIGHEYFHNWSGNRVTCRDWFQLSLKEGFTVFRDEEFSSDLNSRAVKRIDDVNVLRTHQFAQDAGPMAHPIRPDHYMEISNFYTVTVYNKGAEVVRMLQTLVGWPGFRKGTDLYFSRHDGQAVTTEDFVKAIEDANGIDLSQFQHWYNQAGTPEIEFTGDYDPANKTFELTLKQSCPDTPGQHDKQPFLIPVAVGLVSEQGTDIPLYMEGESHDPVTTRVLSLSQPQQSFKFVNVDSAPHVSIGRGFSAPVKFTTPRSDDELAFLFANDSDPFNRWDAGQQLALNLLLRMIRNVQQGNEIQLDERFIDACRATLLDESLDKAFRAQALRLPSESYIADQCEVVDVDAIHQVREFVADNLARALYPDWLSVYLSNVSDNEYQFNAEAMAQRSLKNLCLSYLMRTETEEAIDLCARQFARANNMTDQFAALAVLSNHAIPERLHALETFYGEWKHDNQVVEKWLSIQATSAIANTLDNVKQLMQHEAFSMSNPNKVRSLIGRFCMGNIVQFHAADGSGYKFLADNVIELDQKNPQIAARLVQAMVQWRRYDESRQGLMKAQLERIKSQETVSKDVFEVVNRSLEG